MARVTLKRALVVGGGLFVLLQLWLVMRSSPSTAPQSAPSPAPANPNPGNPLPRPHPLARHAAAAGHPTAPAGNPADVPPDDRPAAADLGLHKPLPPSSVVPPTTGLSLSLSLSLSLVERVSMGRPPELPAPETLAVRGLQCEDHGGRLKHVPPEDINDDFCDCPLDGADEYGTAACAFGRFFCPVERRLLPVGLANDGVCDCCSGADEWQRQRLGPQGQSPPSFSPCPDRCADVVRRQQAEQARLEEGRRIRVALIAQGQAADDGDFGADHAFYKMTLACFQLHAGEYDYEFCPFRSVTQRDARGKSTLLGSHFEWIEPSVAGTMTGGQACPSGQRRQVDIRFPCDLDDAIVHIAEPQRCLYEMLFKTPAACV